MLSQLKTQSTKQFNPFHLMALQYTHEGDSKNAMELYRKAANQGCVDAEFALAAGYYLGQDIARDVHLAFEYFHRAGKQGHTRAQYLLGYCYEHGIGTLQDEKLSCYWYHKAAGIDQTTVVTEQSSEFIGAPDALIKCGHAYEDGRGVEKNHRAAFLCYSKSAMKLHEEGERDLANAYEFGVGTTISKSKAKEYYLRAATKGDKSSQYHIARIYFSENTPESIKKGRDFLLSAVAQNNPRAQRALGTIYQKGLYGFNKNLSLAKHWYEKGLDVHALLEENNGLYDKASYTEYFKGIEFLYGNRQHNPNLAAAFEIFNRLSKKKFIPAMSRLALCYLKGVGVDKNEKRAIDLLNEAKGSNDAYAICLLGQCYQEGKGVTKDEKLAVELFQRAAGQGYEPAKFNLGLCYERGCGVDKNIEAAIYWYEKSGCHRAKLHIELLNLLNVMKPSSKVLAAIPLDKPVLSHQVPARLDEFMSILCLLKDNQILLKNTLIKEHKSEIVDVEREHIRSSPKLDDYYHMMMLQISATQIAAKAIHDGKVENSSKKAIDYVGDGVDSLGKHVPGISIITTIVKGLISLWTSREKAHEVNAIANYFSDPAMSIQNCEKLARKLTLIQEEKINKLESVRAGFFERIFQKGKRLGDLITGNDDVDNCFKELAAKQADLFRDAIIHKKLGKYFDDSEIDKIAELIVGAKENTQVFKPQIKAASEVNQVIPKALTREDLKKEMVTGLKKKFDKKGIANLGDKQADKLAEKMAPILEKEKEKPKVKNSMADVKNGIEKQKHFSILKESSVLAQSKFQNTNKFWNDYLAECITQQKNIQEQKEGNSCLESQCSLKIREYFARCYISRMGLGNEIDKDKIEDQEVRLVNKFLGNLRFDSEKLKNFIDDLSKQIATSVAYVFRDYLERLNSEYSLKLVRLSLLVCIAESAKLSSVENCIEEILKKMILGGSLKLDKIILPDTDKVKLKSRLDEYIKSNLKKVSQPIVVVQTITNESLSFTAEEMAILRKLIAERKNAPTNISMTK